MALSEDELFALEMCGEPEAKAVADIRRLQQELTDSEAHSEALLLKVKSLSSHATCACSYDRADDICQHHSPRLLQLIHERDEAQAKLERMKKLERGLKHLAQNGHVAYAPPICAGCAEIRDALEAQRSD